MSKVFEWRGPTYLIVGILGGAIINLRDRRRRERQQRQIEEYTRALAERGVEKRP